jgi:hypothetical protein
MRIELSGISVELIISEVEEEHYRLPDMTPKRQDFRSSSEILPLGSQVREACSSSPNFNFRNDQLHRNPRKFDPQVNEVLYHLSKAGVTFTADCHFTWDELRARHVIISEAWEADLLAAIAACKGTGLDGGKGHDNVRVKRRAVLDVPAVVWHSQADGGFEISLSF